MSKGYKIAIGVVLAIVAAGYYYYTLPFKIKTSNLIITAQFPDTPTTGSHPTQLSPDLSARTLEYVSEAPGAVYKIAITNLASSYIQQNSYQKILSLYFKYLSSKGKYYGFASIAAMADFNGQTIVLKSKTKLLKGKYFLTSDGIIAITAEVDGQEMTQNGIWFINSLSISEQEGL